MAHGPGIELLGRALLLDAALVHEHHAVGHGQGLFLVVRDHDGGNAQLALQLADLAAQLGAHLGIERGQRLVEQQQARPGRQRTGQGHALLLAARQLGRVALGLRAQAHQGQHLGHTLARLRRRLPVQPEGHVLRGREIGKQRIALEHHAKATACGRPARDVIALEQHPALVRHVDAADDAQQRGLAAARRAEQADELARLHVQVNAAQHLLIAVALGDMVYAQHGVAPAYFFSALAS